MEDQLALAVDLAADTPRATLPSLGRFACTRELFSKIIDQSVINNYEGFFNPRQFGSMVMMSFSRIKAGFNLIWKLFLF